jgi:hypothetical protein
MIGTPLDDRDVDLRQRQLGRQHHPRRTTSGDHHSMLGHTRPPIRDVEKNTRISLLRSVGFRLAAGDYARLSAAS